MRAEEVTVPGGFSTAGLHRLHDVLARHVDDGSVPGLVLAARRGDEVHVEVMGSMAVGGRPMERDARFRISSVTKPITAVAAMSLVEDCVLRLDDPVDDLLPELAAPRVLRRLDGPVEDTVPAVRSVTLRDLLTFRMGTGMLFGDPDEYPVLAALAASGIPTGPPAPDGDPPPDEWIARLAGVPLMHQPGTVWQYHTGAAVLGVLLARAAGRSFDRVVAERVTDPIGMADTAFHVAADRLDRFTTSYVTDPGTGSLLPYDEPDGQWSHPPAFADGGAGLVSTADDLVAFGTALLRGGSLPGGERVLSRPTVELMTTDQLTDEQRAGSGLVLDGLGWGFGMSVVRERTAVGPGPGSFGWDGGLGTTFVVDPAEDLVLVLMTQAAWASPSPPAVARDARTATYAALAD